MVVAFASLGGGRRCSCVVVLSVQGTHASVQARAKHVPNEVASRSRPSAQRSSVARWRDVQKQTAVFNREAVRKEANQG